VPLVVRYSGRLRQQTFCSPPDYRLQAEVVTLLGRSTRVSFLWDVTCQGTGLYVDLYISKSKIMELIIFSTLINNIFLLKFIRSTLNL
jgi:hypothetical protein